MRNLKKFLALVLAIMMAASLMLTANAATANVTFTDDYNADPAFEEAIDVLAGMGVFQGDEKGNFNPAQSITRAETAAIIYRLITGDTSNNQDTLFHNIDHPFTDVTSDKWYAGYVGYLWNAGIIKGLKDANGNATFNPAGKVTGYEALAMILRAVGYDKNHEFEGGNWIYNVALIANNKGILTDVNKTNYGGAALYSAARRDVVASLLFRTAAYVPQVVYTSAFQYQEYGMADSTNPSPTLNNSLIGGKLNPTLGETWFGLGYSYGVILGNEATGEGEHVTKIAGIQRRTTSGGDENRAASAAADVNNPYLYENARTFKWDTGLDWFGHNVKVWYDYRNTTTYAMYDKAAATAVVAADDADLNPGGDLKGIIEQSYGSQENNWSATGMSVRANESVHYVSDNGTPNDPTDDVTVYSGVGNAFFNYAFSAMDVVNYATEATDSMSVNGFDCGVSAESPIKSNNDVNKEVDGNADWPLYLVISNNSSKKVDLVITLDLTFSQIVQENNTTKPKSVGVWNANGDGTRYFGVGDDDSISAIGSVGTIGSDIGTYVNLAQANLVCSPKTARGTKVAAIEITGTKDKAVQQRLFTARNDYGVAGEDGMASAQGPLTSTFFYQLTEPTHVVPATVVKYDSYNEDVYLSDGSVLHKSILSEAVDGTFKDNQYVNAPRNYGTYTFTLDQWGNYIYWDATSNTSNFVYGTYLDYSTVTASSLFNYPLVYVSANGEAKQTKDVTKVTLDGVTHNLSNEVYGNIQINKRDNVTSGNTSGYAKGMYVGYAMSDNGELIEVTSTNGQNTGFLRADANNFGDDVIEINSSSLIVGAEGFGDSQLISGAGDKGWFLTENTQFYVVSGAGTDNQTVKPYKGISELMDGMSKVTIDATEFAKRATKDGTYLKATESVTSNVNDPVYGGYEPYDLVYFSSKSFNYSQQYLGSAQEITTVFIPADLIEFTPAVTGSLYFVGNSESTMYNATGAPATLFTMYQNGQEVSRWIRGLSYEANSSTNDAYKIQEVGKDNVFYTLVKTSDTAKDGEPIYKIQPVASTVGEASKKVVGQWWNGTAAQTTVEYDDPTGAYDISSPLTADANGNTVWYTPTTYSTQAGYLSNDHYRSGSYNRLYNVGSAAVYNTNTDMNTYYTIKTLADLNNAGALADNYGVAVSCVLDSTDGSGLTASAIYVNYQD